MSWHVFLNQLVRGKSYLVIEWQKIKPTELHNAHEKGSYEANHDGSIVQNFQGQHGRDRDIGNRPRYRQCGLCRDRQAPAQDADRRRHVEAAGLDAEGPTPDPDLCLYLWL